MAFFILAVLDMAVLVNLLAIIAILDLIFVSKLNKIKTDTDKLNKVPENFGNFRKSCLRHQARVY